MATRSATRAAPSASSSPAPSKRSLTLATPASAASPQLLELRRQWKWAAFSQFFCTFAQLIALEDVSIADVEEDIVNSTMVVIPRLMQRLLVTLTQDRKITVANWQTALRRQYLKRDPAANPIGYEPVVARHSRAATVEVDIKSEDQDFVPTDASGVPADGQNTPEDAMNDDVKEEQGAETGDEKDVVHLSPSEEVSKDEEEDCPHPTMKEWAEISMLEKLESIHTITEWHFQSPLRLRTIMRSDDENASWRIEPIGYDAKKNAYWLIGLDRLWIQRVPQKKSSKRNGKRKATAINDTRKAKAPRIERTKISTTSNGVLQSPDTSKRDPTKRSSSSTRSRHASRRHSGVCDSPSSPLGNGRARAAKTQANVKLDLQAKQLAAAKAEMESFSRRSTGRNSPSKSSTLGTRSSRRLRGGYGDDDDEWQQIPEEWLPKDEEMKPKSSSIRLNGARNRAQAIIRSPRRPKEDVTEVQSSSRLRARKAGLLSDDESDLTELSDSESSTYQEPNVNADAVSLPVDSAIEGETAETDIQPESAQQSPDFIEWETLCVSLQEWEAIAHKFEKATNYLEKALHKILIQEIVPFVTESLREIEKQRMKEDALMNRKRSSRIAIKVSEMEATRLAAVRQAEEDEKMARLRRLEARARREEEDRLQRELSREKRRKEREERELARNRRMEQDNSEPDEGTPMKGQSEITNNAEDVISSNDAPKPPKPPRRRTERKVYKKTTSSDEWELDCEICGAKGINRDDGVPLMSCGKCNRWQHIACHDALDRNAGRSLRNWEVVDFFCRRCLAPQNGQTYSGYPPKHVHAPGAVNGHGRPYLTQCATGTQAPGPSSTPNRNGIYDARNVNAQMQHASPHSTSFAGFAHYQPNQRGFSSHPSVFQPQFRPQPQDIREPALFTQPPSAHGSQWGHRAHGDLPSIEGINRGSGSLPPSQDARIGGRQGTFSDLQRSYGSNSNGPAPHQTIQYPHSYYLPPQQAAYGNPASYHR